MFPEFPSILETRMQELPAGRWPELQLDSSDARNLVKVLEFRIRCRNEKKLGFISLGFGGGCWIDRDGTYMDDKPYQAEIELGKVLKQLAECGLTIVE